MNSFHHIDVKKEGKVHLARFREGKILNDLVIETVARELYQLADSDECQNMVLSFAGVEFLSSSVLGKLITLNKKMKASGGRLIMCNICMEIQKLLFITNLDKIFEIKEDETDALMAFY